MPGHLPNCASATAPQPGQAFHPQGPGAQKILLLALCAASSISSPPLPLYLCHHTEHHLYVLLHPYMFTSHLPVRPRVLSYLTAVPPHQSGPGVNKHNLNK